MSYSHPRTGEVLEAFEVLLNESMSLDYCGITGKERKLILNDPEFIREARKMKAGKYIEEIKDINSLIKSLGSPSADENARFSEGDEDLTKTITLKMKATAMRREMLSLSANDKEGDESDSLNIFFIDVSKEEFEKMLNVEIHEGDENAKLVGDDSKEAPMESAEKRREAGKRRTSIPPELSKNTIEYFDESGEKIIEEVHG